MELVVTKGTTSSFYCHIPPSARSHQNCTSSMSLTRGQLGRRLWVVSSILCSLCEGTSSRCFYSTACVLRGQRMSWKCHRGNVSLSICYEEHCRSFLKKLQTGLLWSPSVPLLGLCKENEIIMLKRDPHSQALCYGMHHNT